MSFQASLWPAASAQARPQKRTRLLAVPLLTLLLLLQLMAGACCSALLEANNKDGLWQQIKANPTQQQQPAAAQQQQIQKYFTGDAKRQQQQRTGGRMFAFDRKANSWFALLPGLLDDSLLARGSFAFQVPRVKLNKLKVLGNVYVNRVNGRPLRQSYLFSGGPQTGLAQAQAKRTLESRPEAKEGERQQQKGLKGRGEE